MFFMLLYSYTIGDTYVLYTWFPSYYDLFSHLELPRVFIVTR